MPVPLLYFLLAIVDTVRKHLDRERFMSFGDNANITKIHRNFEGEVSYVIEQRAHRKFPNPSTTESIKFIGLLLLLVRGCLERPTF